MTLTPADAETDQVLILAVADGDERAFRTLYRRYTPKLRGLVLRMLGGHQSESDDVVQDSWLRAVGSIRRFRGDSSFSSWLNGIGVRVTWEAIRRRRPTIALVAGDEPRSDSPDSAERLDLEEALRQLPDEQRTVVVLHDVEGFGHDAIAESLGIAVGTSRSHLSRARKALR